MKEEDEDDRKHEVRPIEVNFVIPIVSFVLQSFIKYIFLG